MNRASIGLFAIAAVGLAGTAFAAPNSINSVVVTERAWNDFPASTLVTTNAYPASVRFQESFPQFTPGNFANKHWATFSNDGATDYLFQQSEDFTITTTVRVNAVAGQPRKEAGLFFRNPHQVNPLFINEGAFMVASDGEVAVFGAGLDFHGFGGAAYTLGTTATLEFRYYHNGVIPQYEAIFNGISSGVKGFGDPDFQGFNNGSRIALQAQNQRNPLIADFSDIEYGGTSVVPTPASFGVMGLGLLAMGRRRR